MLKKVTMLPCFIFNILHVPPGISIIKLPLPGYIVHYLVLQGGQL